MSKKKRNRPSGFYFIKNNTTALLILCWAVVLGLIAVAAFFYWKNIF